MSISISRKSILKKKNNKQKKVLELSTVQCYRIIPRTFIFLKKWVGFGSGAKVSRVTAVSASKRDREKSRFSVHAKKRQSEVGEKRKDNFKIIEVKKGKVAVFVLVC